MLRIFLLISALAFGAQPEDISRAQSLLESASTLYEKGEYAAAIEHYQKFLRQYHKDPRGQAAQMMVAECMRESGYSRETASDRGDTMLFRDPKVVKEYEKVIKMNASSALAESASFRLVEMLYNAGSYNEAAGAWDRFLDRYPDGYLKAEALFSLSQTLAMLQRWEELDQTVMELVRVNPAYEENEEVVYLTGMAAFARARYSKATESFDKLQTPTSGSLYYSGKSLLGAQKPLLAASKFQQLLQKFPGDPLTEEAHYLLAESFFLAEDYLGAVAEYENFLQAYPHSLYAQAASYKIGLAHFARGNYFDARSAFQTVTGATSRSEFAAWSQYLIGETYLRQKQFKEASFSFADMSNNFLGHPFAGNALFKLAWCSYLEKNYQSAEAHLKKLTLTYPGHALSAPAQVLLGNTLTRQDKHSEAALSYQRAVDLSFPSDIAEAALALGNRAMMMDQNYGSLVSAYHLLLNNYPPSANPWRAMTYLFVGEGYFRNSLYNEAINIYRTILRLYPANPAAIFAQDGIAWSYFKLGKPKEAEQEREKLKIYIQESPALAAEYFPANDYEAANALFNQKKYTEALEKYEKFSKENPAHETAPEALLRAGMCYAQLSYHGQAIDSWETLRKNYPQSPPASQAAWKIADTYFRAAKYDSAIVIYRDILKQQPTGEDSAVAALRIAQSFYNSKQGAQAMEEFKNLILKYPEHPNARESLNFLSGLLEQPSYKAQALETLRGVAQALGGKNAVGAEAQLRIAQSWFDAKNYPEAVKELENLSGKYLDTAWLADKEYYLGESYYQVSRFEDSTAAFERLVKNFPADSKLQFALFRLGGAYFKLNKFPESATAFDRLAREFPKSDYAANALYNSAISYKKARRWEEAKTALTAFMRAHPEKAKESQAQEEMVSLYLETKDYRSANDVLEGMRKDLPPASDPYADYSSRMAENLILQGDSAAAISEYEKIVNTMAPKNQWRLNASIKLVDLYEKNEKWQEAVKVYEDIVRNAPKPEWITAAKARLDFIRSNHPEAFLKGGN